MEIMTPQIIIPCGVNQHKNQYQFPRSMIYDFYFFKTIPNKRMTRIKQYN